MAIDVVDFDIRHQEQAAKLINDGLGDQFGFTDASLNPDLLDIASSYEGCDFLVALDGERVVGTGALKPIDIDNGQIVRVHTVASHRRRGIARRLVWSLEQRAAVRGIRCITLETNRDWHVAIAFYTGQGYREVDRSEHEIYFQKRLA